MSPLREKMIRELKLKTMSEKTIKNYVSYIFYLSRFYKKSPDKINREEVKKYLYHLRVNRKLSANTLNVVHCAIRFFYIHVINAEWVVKDIAKYKRDKSKPVVLSQSEVEAILNLTWNLKHKTILTLIYSAGLRVSEAIQRAFRDARFKAGIIKEASVHTLRHSFATHLLEAGVHMHHIQLLLGHFSPQTTYIYLHVKRMDLMNIKSPLDTYDYNILTNPIQSGSLANGNIQSTNNTGSS